MCESPLPVSEVVATSAAVSRSTTNSPFALATCRAQEEAATAIHSAQRHLCSRFVSASSSHRHFSTAYRVYADASDHRVRRSYTDTLASEPPLHTYCGTCKEIRSAAPSFFRGLWLFPRLRQRLGILVLLPYRKFPFALATCRAQEVAATALPPSP
jgi:hypothetical protein